MTPDERRCIAHDLEELEDDLHIIGRRIRYAAHVEPLVRVPQADEAQALATLVSLFRRRIEAAQP